MSARVRVAALAVVAGALLGSPAFAAGTEEHRALMVAGQLLRSDGKLLRAAEVLEDCATVACDADADAECVRIREFCQRRLGELRAELPTLAIAVVDDRGVPLPGATARVGTRVVANGEVVRVDPGRHLLEAEYLGRRVALSVEARRGVSTPARAVLDLRVTRVERPVRGVTWALAGGALVGLASAAVFGSLAAARAGGLEDCRPTCGRDERTSLETFTIGADVGLGVFALSSLGAVFSHLSRPEVRRTVRLGEPEGGPRW